MKNKEKYILPIVSALLFAVLVILLKTVDVAAAGPENVTVGLSHLNGAALNFFGNSTTWYKITEITGYTAIASCSIFVIVGLVQLISRKSLFKVDREIFAVGGLYVVLGVLYVAFDKITINSRPMLAPGETAAESSFPSSHTMLSLVLMVSMILLLKKYIKNKTIRQIISALCAALAVITVIGRLLSGVHWLTDILGAVFLSVFLLSVFSLFLKPEK